MERRALLYNTYRGCGYRDRRTFFQVGGRGLTIDFKWWRGGGAEETLLLHVVGLYFLEKLGVTYAIIDPLYPLSIRFINGNCKRYMYMTCKG